MKVLNTNDVESGTNQLLLGKHRAHWQGETGTAHWRDITCQELWAGMDNGPCAFMGSGKGDGEFSALLRLFSKDWLKDLYPMYKVLGEWSGAIEYFCLDLVWDRHHREHVICLQILNEFNRLKKKLSWGVGKRQEGFHSEETVYGNQRGKNHGNTFQPHFLNAHLGNVAKE